MYLTAIFYIFLCVCARARARFGFFLPSTREGTLRAMGNLLWLESLWRSQV